jgi:predicted N-acetyltransferase YhbS
LDLREITPAQLKEVNALVSESFGYTAPHAFFDDFPIWGSILSDVVRLGIFDSGNLVSHVGIRYCEMKTSNGLVSIALIGAVATEQKFRGRGFSSALLKEALKRIDQKGCAWTLLWGSEHEFYGKLGFHLSGKQGRAKVSDLSVGSKMNLVPEVHVDLTEPIFQLLQKEPTGIKLSEKDRAWVFEHKTIQWLSLKDPVAFVAYDRGMDLKHIVHEFGGNFAGVERLLYQIYSQDSAVEVLGTPENLKKLGFDETHIVREFLCLARPRNEKEVWDESFWVAGISAS